MDVDATGDLIALRYTRVFGVRGRCLRLNEGLRWHSRAIGVWHQGRSHNFFAMIPALASIAAAASRQTSSR
jgi:hypothetical protein